MAFLPTSAPIDWGRILSAAGQGFMQAGTPGGNFGQGLMQGAQFYDQGVDRRKARELEDLRLDLARQEQEANRLANTKAAQEEAALQALINGGGGVQTASAQPVRQIGNYGASVGGATPAQAAQGQPFFDPDTAAKIRMLPPSLQKAAVEAQLGNMFAEPEKPETTDDLTEYAMYKSQGGTEDFTTWLRNNRKSGAASTKVDVHAPSSPTIGTIPPGYVAIPDGTGKWVFEKIPGGPAADEAAALANKAADVQTSKEQTSDIVTEEINRVLQMGKEATLPTTGGTGAVLSYIPGTASFDTGKLLDTIKSNIGFDRLQQMRDQSPTGGALGNVTKPEMDLLQAAKGSLAQSQSPQQFEYNLKRLYNLYLDTVHGPGGGGPRYDLGAAAPGPGAPQGGDLKSKYGLE